MAVSGSNNCLFDAVLAQVDQQERDRLGLQLGNDLRIATALTLIHNGRIAQQVVQDTNTLAAQRPEGLWAGGKSFRLA